MPGGQGRVRLTGNSYCRRAMVARIWCSAPRGTLSSCSVCCPGLSSCSAADKCRSQISAASSTSRPTWRKACVHQQPLGGSEMTASAISPLFTSRAEEVLFWVSIFVGFVIPFLYFVRWTNQNAASMKNKPARDVSTLTNFALIPVAVIAILLGYARIGALPHWLLYPGLTMFLLGLALTVWAYRTLGRFFS